MRNPVSPRGKGLEAVFHSQHTLRIFVTIIANLLGDVAPQGDVLRQLTFNTGFQFANIAAAFLRRC